MATVTLGFGAAVMGVGWRGAQHLPVEGRPWGIAREEKAGHLRKKAQ